MKNTTAKKKESNTLTIAVSVTPRTRKPPQRGKVHKSVKAYNRRSAKKIEG